MKVAIATEMPLKVCISLDFIVLRYGVPAIAQKPLEEVVLQRVHLQHRFYALYMKPKPCSRMAYAQSVTMLEYTM